MEALLFIIGHLAVGIYFLHAGINHFFKLNYLAGYASSKGVPFPKVSVIAAGVLFLAGGLLITSWILPEIGIGLVLLALLPITTMMHNFWTASDPMHRANEQMNFNKNIALIGSLCILLAFVLG